jgi:hypothetical protein
MAEITAPWATGRRRNPTTATILRAAGIAGAAETGIRQGGA